MQPVLTYGLRVGKRVDVLFGEPMDFTEQVRRMKSSGDSEVCEAADNTLVGRSI